MPTSDVERESGAGFGSSTYKDANDQFWLFTVYDKDEADDLTPDQRKMLKQRLEAELKARGTKK